MIETLRELSITIQLSVGLVFLTASLSKLRHWKAFIQGVANYRILSQVLVLPFASFTVAFEFLVAIAHLTGWYLDLAIPLSISLIFVFMLATGVTIRRGIEVPCYCFGSHKGDPISWKTFAEQVVLLLAESALLFILTTVPISPIRVGEIATQELLFGLLSASVCLLAVVWILRVPTLFSLIKECRSCRGWRSAVGADKTGSTQVKGV